MEGMYMTCSGFRRPHAHTAHTLHTIGGADSGTAGSAKQADRSSGTGLELVLVRYQSTALLPIWPSNQHPVVERATRPHLLPATSPTTLQLGLLTVVRMNDLHRAAIDGSIERTVTILSQDSIDIDEINEDGVTPLMLAVMNNHAPVVLSTWEPMCR